MDLLAPSDKVTRCPFKGKARYYSIKIDDKLFGDLVWTYPDPIPECPKIKGYLCFFNEHVDDILATGLAAAANAMVEGLERKGADGSRSPRTGGSAIARGANPQRDSGRSPQQAKPP